MYKIVVFLLVLLVAWYFWQLKRKPVVPPTAAAGDPENMVVCAHCGLHLPASDAITVGSRSFCCDEHRSHDAV